MIYSKYSTYAQEAREQVDGSILKEVFLACFIRMNKWTETSVKYKAVHPFSYRVYLRTFARKTSTIQIFFILWLKSDNELPMSEMQKNWGVTDFVFKIKRVENHPSFDKSAHATRHGLSAC